MADLHVIVPSRGRPANVKRVIEAWEMTGAYEHATLEFAVDADDPAIDAYLTQSSDRAWMGVATKWRPMVHKLNVVATTPLSLDHFALGFAGDDHLPRTPGWARAYLNALYKLGTGIVYGNDLHRGRDLPTQWAMTADIVRALGRMVPAPVEHQFCDRSILDLGRALGRIRNLPDVIIEHMHPAAEKARWDDGYLAVNRKAQFVADRARYEQWRAGQLPADVAAVQAVAR